MKASSTYRTLAIALVSLVALCASTAAMGAAASEDAASAVVAEGASTSLPPPPAIAAPPRHGRAHGDDALVSFGRDSHLDADRHAQSVVSIFGSSTDEGRAGDVVSIFGNTHVAGTSEDGAVAVFGNTTVDGAVSGDAVAVFGTVTLGPKAVVGGDVVAIGGRVVRDPGAVVHGDVNMVRIGPLSDFDWLHPWIAQCLLYGRPLAFAPGLSWAWWFALGLLAFYALLAAAFREGTASCVHTLESRPGETVLAALVATLSIPVLIVLLCITVIGIAAVPFVLLGLLIATLFGKVVVLAWLGRLVTGRRAQGALGELPVVTLIGGAIALVLYVVPGIGFIAHQVLTLLGLGAVMYTLIRVLRARQGGTGPAAPTSAPGPDPTVTAAPSGDATPAAAAQAAAGEAAPGAAPAGPGSAAGTLSA
ncbi:MAG: hypothetical protein KGL34_10105, partial [Gammaproteobacteria bacterium]|nr:hypothetical protein [Gammaproteobacteria bacterium]